MKKLLFILIFLPFVGFGQCISGDCFNGYGVFTSSEGTYKGYFKETKPHGNGVFEGSYYTYDGEYINGKQHGQGKKIWTSGKIEEGLFKNGKFIKADIGCISDNCQNGYGAYTYANGDKYVGNWNNSKRNGYGTYTWGKGEWEGNKYEGEWKNGKRNGHATYTSASGDKYVGKYKDGKRNGYGTYTYASGDKYVGQWRDSEKHGQGTFTSASGTVKTGEWINNVYQSPVKSNTSTTGCISGDCYNGHGTKVYTNGDKYAGNWNNGKRNGYGTYTYAGGDKYVGQWKDNNRTGYGTYTYASGTVKTGEWINGVYQSPVKSTKSTSLFPSFSDQSGMSPKDQIGYITNLSAHLGGVNYFLFSLSSNENIGWYCDWRPSLNFLQDKSSGKGWIRTLNLGAAVNMTRKEEIALILYAGLGATSQKIYPEDISDTKANLNIGFLYQSDRLISWQLGYDTAIKGINIGVGKTFD